MFYGVHLSLNKQENYYFPLKILFGMAGMPITLCFGSDHCIVLEAECSLTPHIVEHLENTQMELFKKLYWDVKWDCIIVS